MVALHLSTIQRYSTKDGPGIRSTVFLIGCNLRCAWCSNPELMLPYDKLLHFSSLCRGCQSCVHAYPTAVYMEDGAIHMHPCAQHMAGELEEACPFDALEQVGMRMEPIQLAKQLEKDFTYYEESGGGVTFSGGEPLLQAAALCDTLYLLKQKQIAVCVDTAGDVAWEQRTIAICFSMISKPLMLHYTKKSPVQTTAGFLIMQEDWRRCTSRCGFAWSL